MDKINSLITLQEDRLEQVQKAQLNFNKSPKQRINLSYLETRLETLENINNLFTKCHEEITSKIPRDERTTIGYFITDTFEKFEELYTNYKGTLKEKMKEFCQSQQMRTLSPSRTTNLPEVKLPTIHIPTFSGKYTEWPSFSDLFISIIHNNASLDDVRKLHYLKSLLSGEAEQLLKTITVTSQNYTLAWETISKRYNNVKYISNCILKRLFGIKTITSESGQLLKQLLDITSECINSLSNIGITTENWDVIVVYLTVTKLDPTSHRLWEQHVCTSDDLPTFQMLCQFLETRFRALEMCESNLKTVKSKLFHVNTMQHNCIFCKGDHYIYQCKQFSKKTYSERRDFAQANKLCFNCLIPNHDSRRCMRNTFCRVSGCNKKHHSLLHPEKKYTNQETQELTNQEDKNIVAHFIKQPGQVLLATALVDVAWKNNKTHTYRALIDPGSQATFVTEDLVQSAGLKRIKINGLVSGLSEGSSVHVKYMVEFRIRSRIEPHFTLSVNAYVLKKITNHLPSQQCIVTNWPDLEQITLADPTFNMPNKVDLLLGAEVYAQIINDGLLKSPGGVVAQKTHLGWILSGGTTETKQNVVVNMHICECESTLLKKFWEIENDVLTSERKQTKDEMRCEEIYKNTTIKTKDNRYKVCLPFKDGCEKPAEICGNTREVAISRFVQLERRFKRDPEFKEDYTKVIHEYLDLGHMEIADNDIKNTVYLPHHAVIRNDKITSKTRVVFDASAKGSNFKSLNDTLLVGPTLQKDLRTLIMNWRQYKIVLVSDLVKMYRQVLIADEHTDYQRIIWRDDPDEQYKSYKLLTVTFGTASAPYLAVRTLLQTAEDNKKDYPLAAEITKTSFYMDDLLTGCHCVDQGIEIYNQMNELMAHGGFELRKWCSNSNELLARISKDKQHLEETYEIKFDNIVKILGLCWDRNQDKFKFSVNLPEIAEIVTKRKVLSDVARLFDPFGWLAPIIIVAKVFLQKLWLSNSGWDDQLPPQLLDEWKTYRNQLKYLQNIELDRWLSICPNQTSVEIHGFADASMVAYAAVVYTKVITDDEKVIVTLLESKTKVAPLKQISVARLELCAAHLLAKLLSQTANNLKIPKSQIYAYTDSTVVLAWIEGQPNKWQTFVANRVSEIQTLLDNHVWNHVTSKENPADLASRGIQPSDLTNCSLWWQGPNFLKERVNKRNRNKAYTTNLEERKQNIKSFHSEMEEKPIYERFSSLNKLIRVLSYCRRFLHLKHKKEISMNKTTYLNTKEMKETLQICITIAQRKEFMEEIKDLKEKGSVKKRSKLLTLSPYLDEQHILRVGGRLQGAKISTEVRHPIILPKGSHLTMLIIRDAHIKLLHGGNRLVANYIQNQYWVIGLKPMIKGILRKCVICLRHKGITVQPRMGELPAIRITPGRPFEVSGLDFAGPVQMRPYKGRGYKSVKGYICLFVCMKTKAVHLEVVSDLTSQGFLACFKKFVARRGHCSQLWSDNATNFVGAARELKEMFDQAKSNLPKEIAESLANDGTTWNFIPPRAPNFGGLWESAVKSVKNHLVKVLGNSTLTFEEMSTLLAQIEACLNSRPIGELNDHPDDLMPLTPAHFLIGESTMLIPEPSYENVKLNALDRWTLIQKMTQHFWQRWSNEYLHLLQQRQKWHKSSPYPEVGQVVLIKDDDLPPTKWSMGRVTGLHVGPDNQVRVAELKCKSTILKRPLNKLVMLPKDNN
ncbi:uncharacterized protein LOC112045429 [Bicyclus anynana]|uniref:Uncharacterized protein LOC112045429 n=1 Tax=Bicyclus anynana TaxID=110368 RepID=A0ABM3LPT4_BICAN|nr:uncharacterized protein LOC112045429 [Bicyclus anynana]